MTSPETGVVGNGFIPVMAGAAAIGLGSAGISGPTIDRPISRWSTLMDLTPSLEDSTAFAISGAAIGAGMTCSAALTSATIANVETSTSETGCSSATNAWGSTGPTGALKGAIGLSIVVSVGTVRIKPVSPIWLEGASAVGASPVRWADSASAACVRVFDPSGAFLTNPAADRTDIIHSTAGFSIKGLAVRPWRAVLSMATSASTEIGPSPMVGSMVAPDGEGIEESEEGNVTALPLAAALGASGWADTSAGAAPGLAASEIRSKTRPMELDEELLSMASESPGLR